MCFFKETRNCVYLYPLSVSVLCVLLFRTKATRRQQFFQFSSCYYGNFTSLLHSRMFLESNLLHSVWWSLDLSLYKVKRTPSAGNTLILNKGDGLEESLHWRAEIHRFPEIPVKYIIHSNWFSKSDVLHTFWEQVGRNSHCWIFLCIGVREQESVQLHQRQLCTSALSNKKYELQ